MTTLADDPAAADGRPEEPAPPPPPHRLLGRLSTGHVLMVLAGVVAAVANYAALTQGEARTTVLVADTEIAAGDPLEPDALSVAEIDAGGPLADRLVAASERAHLADAVAAARVEPGEPLRRSDVQDAAAPGEQRAMSVPVEAAHAVGGALRPGDRVDVIETGDAEAAYLVTDAEVLAVPERGDSSLEGLSGFSVTIAVSANEALQLAEAVHEGELDVVRATGAAPAEGAAPSDAGGAP